MSRFPRDEQVRAEEMREKEKLRGAFTRKRGMRPVRNILTMRAVQPLEAVVMSEPVLPHPVAARIVSLARVTTKGRVDVPNLGCCLVPR